MFDRIARSWQLVKASWEVLKADRELLLFPLISGIATLIVMISFIVPTFAAGIFDSAQGEDGIPIAGYIIGFLFYVVMYTVTIFFNSALVGAALIRLDGGDPTVQDGFSIAFGKIGVILQYALIAATVGMVLRAMRERGGIVGSIASWIGGVAWSLATFLVVPVLVAENVNPIDAIKRSASLLKETWGEQVVGNFSIGLIFGLISFVIILGGIFGAVFFAAMDLAALAVATVIAMIMILVFVNLIGSTLSGIYVAAVYRYAVDGQPNQYFAEDLIQGAFRQK